MAGRGRGRGRGMSFNVESLGFGRGESLPGSLLQPPPLFPTLDFKAVPLEAGEEWDYLLALKQEYSGTMKDSAYFIKPSEKKRDIERYSDKYQLGQQDNGNSWQPDWSRLPSELKIRTKKRSRLKPGMKPSIPTTQYSAVALKPEEIQKHLEALAEKEAKQEGEGEEENEEKEEKEAEEELEEELYDEEDLEEETDYNLNYFDNGDGDGMGDEEDDVDDGPTY